MKKKKIKVKSLSKKNKIKININNPMNITKLVLTESDGTITESTISTVVTSVVATLEDGSEVKVFPTSGTPVPPNTPSFAIPLDTPIVITKA